MLKQVNERPVSQVSPGPKARQHRDRRAKVMDQPLQRHNKHELGKVKTKDPKQQGWAGKFLVI